MQVLQKHWLHSVFRFWEGAIIYFLHLYSATSFYSRRRAGSCCSENKRTAGLMSFKCLWCVFPAISMETLRRDRVWQGEGYHVSHVFFKLYRFAKKTLDGSLFSTIHIPTDQVNLCFPMCSWEWVSGMRCQLEINKASLHQSRRPIFVWISLIPTFKLNFYLIFGKASCSLPSA